MPSEQLSRLMVSCQMIAFRLHGSRRYQADRSAFSGSYLVGFMRREKYGRIKCLAAAIHRLYIRSAAVLEER